MPAAPALVLRALRKTYGDVVALEGLDLEVAQGECVAANSALFLLAALAAQVAYLRARRAPS